MSDNTKLILLVEDEEKLSAILSEYLVAAGFKVQARFEGTGIVEEVKEMNPNLILLDLMLPGKDGIEICKEIRSFSEVPIIMVTAKVDEIDRLLGLELGADDYICKPYSPREVVARVKAVMRRFASPTPQREGMVAGLQLDEDRFMASINGIHLDLTPVEFRLIKTLSSFPGKVFSRDQLMECIYSDQRIVTDRTVDTHVKNLRKKVHDLAPGDDLIHSVYGVGYKLEL